MYRQEELDRLDAEYFHIIIAEPGDVTVMSKCTGHVWKMRCIETPDRRYTVIQHKHRAEDNYHVHGQRKTLGMAISSIKNHDAFELNGRRPVRKQK